MTKKKKGIHVNEPKKKKETPDLNGKNFMFSLNKVLTLSRWIKNSYRRVLSLFECVISFFSLISKIQYKSISLLLHLQIEFQHCIVIPPNSLSHSSETPVSLFSPIHDQIIGSTIELNCDFVSIFLPKIRISQQIKLNELVLLSIN